jgi:hypothetical protein
VTTGSRFTLLEEFLDRDEIISGDKFLKTANMRDDFKYLKRDFLYRNGVWRGKEIRSLISDIESYNSKVLVLGHSDIPTSKIDAQFVKLLGIPRLFAVNHQEVSNYSRAIPLGVTNGCDDSPLHKILGNESHFLKANSMGFNAETFSPTLYLNFTTSNNSSVRERILSLVGKFSELYKVTLQTPKFTEKGRVKYLEDLRAYGLVLCPEGNGVDTHRFWETLYMGGLPVVTTNKRMKFFYDNLPVLQLNKWEQLLDRSFVEKKWMELSKNSYNFDMLSTKYWLSKFQI